VTEVPLASCPSWRCRIWRPVSACDSVGGRLVVFPLCVVAVVVRTVRVGRKVQRTRESITSGWRVWCCGDLGVDWAEVLLSERFDIRVLGKGCEMVGEMRPSRRVARSSGFHRCCDGRFLLMLR
jgi:hypothetical protein